MHRTAFRRGLRAIVVLLCLFVLAGCGSTGPTIRTNADQSADLTRFRTFTFMQPLSTDRQGYQSMISRRLIDATERELAGLGFQRVESGADFMVNFSARLDDRLRVTQSPSTSMGAWGSHRRGFYNSWPVYRTDVQQYTQGTLVVDIVDVARNQLVWEGVAQRRITSRTAEDAGPLIDTAIREIFARFPARAN